MYFWFLYILTFFIYLIFLIIFVLLHFRLDILIFNFLINISIWNCTFRTFHPSFSMYHHHLSDHFLLIFYSYNRNPDMPTLDYDEFDFLLVLFFCPLLLLC